MTMYELLKYDIK